MLSCPRWTLLDTYAAISVVALAARVFSGGAEASTQPGYARDQGIANPALVRVIEQPMEDPVTSYGLGRQVRLDAALRCIGLAEAARDRACLQAGSRACRSARRQVEVMETSLWPKGRTGQFATAWRSRVNSYALAYSALNDPLRETPRASSELILTRDNAMCRRHREYFEAHAHGQQTRQPG